MKEKFLNVLSWFDKKSASVMAIVAIIMCISLFQSYEAQNLTRRSLNQTEESLQMNHEALELQKKEFELRNRPYVAIKNYTFAGEAISTEKQLYPYSVKMDIENLSEIPANRLKGFHQVFLNGKVVCNIPINEAAIVKGGTSKAHVFLQEDTYSAAMDEKNTFKLVTELTYSGMLGEEADAYKTSVTVYYSVPEKVFKYENAKYE
ncbi:MAG: hypothetical protein PHY02_03685 [Phycisphaerae bacterium]|nr:hypothetical protein [Phycisphaerae bacterium]